VAHEGIKTNFEVWSFAWNPKILGRLKLFQLVVTGVGGTSEKFWPTCNKCEGALGCDQVSAGDAPNPAHAAAGQRQRSSLPQRSYDIALVLQFLCKRASLPFYRFSAASQLTTTVMGAAAELSGVVETLSTRNRFPSAATS